MKKVIALVLAAILMVSLFSITMAENEVLTTQNVLANSEQVTSFKIVDYSYNGEFVTGKVVISGPALEGKNLNVRATFFLEGNNYMSTSQVIAEDGTFEITASGSIEHITLVVFSFTKLSDKSTHTTYSESAVEFDVTL